MTIEINPEKKRILSTIEKKKNFLEKNCSLKLYYIL